MGKTEVSIRVAERVGGEIVSADSRQLYRLMNIGTAKPSPDELKRVPHHFIDFLNPGEPFSAGEFGRLGREKIADILGRGKTPVVVGGSGLYIRALIDGLGENLPSDRQIRRRIDRRIDREGLRKVYDSLVKVDPEYATLISPHDRKRIQRALEVYEITGKPFSQHHHEPSPAVFFQPLFFGLTMDREGLYLRINQRVEQMIEGGLVDEVKRLIRLGYGPGLNALQTVGYQEVFDYLEEKLTFFSMLDEIKKNSRRYAKRQLTWFRADPRIQWLAVDRMNSVEIIVDVIVEKFNRIQ